MFGALNLTADQKAQAKSIFDAQRQAAQPIQDQLDTARKALYAAAKSGAADAQLEQLAAAEAPLLGQLEGVRAKAFAKFYAILTPEQKQKIDSMPGGGMGFGMMGGPGGPGGPRGFGRPRSQQ